MKRIFFVLITFSCLFVNISGKNNAIYSREQVINHLNSFQAKDYYPDEIIVKLKNPLIVGFQKSKSGIVSLHAVLAQFPGIDIKPLFPWVNKNNTSGGLDLSKYYRILLRNQMDIRKIAKSVMRLDEVEYAEPCPYLHLYTYPNDSLYSSQWNLNQINMEKAWGITQGDSSIVIAIVDDGVDYKHPDLAKNMWTNPIDGSHGYDIYNNDNDPMPGSGYWHGTHVAGIAAARTNNRIGIAGIAPNCRIMAVKATSDENSFNISYGYEGVLWATLNGADIINCSWGGAFSFLGKEIIDNALSKGIVIVASAGNDHFYITDSEIFPACYKGVLSVAATNKADQLSSYSNYGYTVSVSAPGDSVISTDSNNSYLFAYGTSFAAPAAAGLAALIKSVHKDFTAQQIVQQIRVTSDIIDYKNPGYHNKIGFGRINAYGALTKESPAIHVSSFSVSDSLTGNGDNIFEPGETVRLSLFITNYLKPCGPITITIYGIQQDITVQSFSQTIDGLGTLQTSTKPVYFDVKLNKSLHFNERVGCLVAFSVGLYSDYDPIFFTANPAVRTHNINNITLTIADEGNIGFEDYPANEIGLGFKYKSTGRKNYLNEGGLIVARDSIHLVDCVRGNDPNVPDNDFIPVKNSISTPGLIADQQGEGLFSTNSNASEKKLNLNIKYTSYAWANPPNNNTIFVFYTITNNYTNSSLNNLYAGMFLDWNVGNFSRNIISIDSSFRLGYAYDFSQIDSTIYVGIVMLGRIPL